MQLQPALDGAARTVSPAGIVSVTSMNWPGAAASGPVLRTVIFQL